MIRIVDPSVCCGCTACMAVCPHDAIFMKEDRLGFPYPEVDQERCVDCGLCEKVCDFAGRSGSHGSVSEDFRIEVTAARHSDPEVLARSQSGGAFTALSDVILEDGGTVYGAAFHGTDRVCHKRAESGAERNGMRTSKYVQSEMGQVFRQVKSDLKTGRKVIFTGTPCQVAGLKSYIPDNLSSDLVLVDFVCHGVPSPAIWRDYVKYMERRGGVVKVTFRDKKVGGWKNHVETFVYGDGEKKTAETFRVLFYKNIMLRHSCAVCPYNIAERMSDITIADFWGVDEVLPEMDDNVGTSMIVCNTNKGRELLNKASGALQMQTASLDHDFVSRRNPNLLRPAKIYKDRMKFEEEYAARGFLYVARRWGDLGMRYKLWKLKRLISGLLDWNK